MDSCKLHVGAGIEFGFSERQVLLTSESYVQPQYLFNFYFMYRNVCMHVYMCNTCMPSAYGGQKREPIAYNYSYT